MAMWAPPCFHAQNKHVQVLGDSWLQLFLAYRCNCARATRSTLADSAHMYDTVQYVGASLGTSDDKKTPEPQHAPAGDTAEAAGDMPASLTAPSSSPLSSVVAWPVCSVSAIADRSAW